MGIFSRLSGIDSLREELGKTKEKAVTLGAGFLEMFDRKGLTDYKTVSEKLLESYQGWVYANVSALAEEVSKIEFELHRIRVARDNVEFEEIKSHPLLDLLDRFNDFTATSEALFLTQAHIELAGDAFYLLDGQGANIQNIFILQPDKVHIKIGQENGLPIILGYMFKDNVEGKTVEINYDPDEVIQIKTPNPNNPFRGKSVVEAAATTIDTDNLASEWNKMFFKNAAVPNFILSSDQRIGRDDLTRIEADLKRNFSGVRNAWKTMILGGGLKPETLQMSNKDLQFLEQQKWTRDKIMALFKNTKTSLGIVDDVNRANAEASQIAWKQNVIKPKMQRIVDNLNEFLVPRYGENLILTFKDPVPENRTEKIDEVVKLRSQAEVITVNEAREMIGLDPMEGEEFDGIMRATPQADPEKNIANVDWRKVLRRNGLMDKWEMHIKAYEYARKKVRQLNGKKKQPEAKEDIVEHAHYSNEEVYRYYDKQIHAVEVIEDRFKNQVEQIINRIASKAISNLNNTGKQWLKRKQTQLFDKDAEVAGAIDLLTPLLNEIAQLSGQEANDLLNIQQPYVQSDAVKEAIKVQTKLLANSFIGTDLDKLQDILSSGIEQGQSIPEIERRIRGEFVDRYTKIQSERIARTEVLKASNRGALDAYEESGVVEAKQWFTSLDSRVCPYCAPLHGKIISLGKAYFNKGDSYIGDAETPIKLDYDKIDAPPLHVSCRCIALPVLKDIRELEADGLTKTIDEMKRELADNKAYVKELEELLEVSDADKG